MRRTASISLRPIALLSLAAGLVGCQAGHTYVLETSTAPHAWNSVRVEEMPAPRADLEPADKDYFRQQLGQQLAPFHPTPDGELTLRYRVVLYDAGSGPARVGAALVSITGVPMGAVGMGTLGIEATYTDPAGAVLARIVADGPIDGPLATTRMGLDTAATSIAAFTKAHFMTAPTTQVALAPSPDVGPY